MWSSAPSGMRRPPMKFYQMGGTPGVMNSWNDMMRMPAPGSQGPRNHLGPSSGSQGPRGYSGAQGLHGASDYHPSSGHYRPQGHLGQSQSPYRSTTPRPQNNRSQNLRPPQPRPYTPR